MKPDYRNVLPGCIEYPIPLREGGNCFVILPRDLSLTEARRVAAIVESLVDVTKTAVPWNNAQGKDLPGMTGPPGDTI